MCEGAAPLPPRPTAACPGTVTVSPPATASHSRHKVANRQMSQQIQASSAWLALQPGGAASLDGLEHGREILIAEPTPRPGGVELAREGGEREAGAGRASVLQAQQDVLEHVLQLEERREVVREHRLALELEHRR